MLFAYTTHTLKLNYFLGQILGLVTGQFVFSFLILKNKWYENLTAGLVVAVLLIVLFILTDVLISVIITDNNPHHEKYYEWIIIGVPIIISILFWEIILRMSKKIK